MRQRLKAWFGRKLSHFLAKVDDPFYTPINTLANFYLRLKNPDRIQHLGKLHPDKVFYIIRDTPSHAGIASWYDRVLGYVLRAKRKGWIPVVDPPPPMQSKGCLSSQRLKNVTSLENNLFYLLDLMALSECDYIFGGLVGAVLMALNLKGNSYKGVYILKT